MEVLIVRHIESSQPPQFQVERADGKTLASVGPDGLAVWRVAPSP